MPRPCKQRRVCGHPPCGRFGPAGQDAGPEVVMGVDEFEAIRLIDLEGLTQEECAAQMNVARTGAREAGQVPGRRMRAVHPGRRLCAVRHGGGGRMSRTGMPGAVPAQKQGGNEHENCGYL